MLPESVRGIECTIPILPVANLRRSVDFYTQTAGFRLDWGQVEANVIASVSRDGAALMLRVCPEPISPGWVWIGLCDESLMDEWRARGIRVLQEPLNFSWAYEMKFADPDGNVLWLGTEPRHDEPLVDR